ncbi:tocopherol cyclase family protein [Faecalimicrobium dakarense]|uniref:tocopherol cyclase family protein n=1 Tax=Faecalimicrobium dakarense TaxID=1301100 RepID=UPI0004B29DBB|nr:tocopherol cyclase family protein [[Clostridium] dakarense]
MKSLINPDLYHGIGKNNNFFEGWYFKIVDKNNLYKFAFIPGISFGQKKSENHSFIQIIDSSNNEYKYIKFNENAFKFNNKNFKIGIRSNIFSLDKISLNLKYKNKTIRGNLSFKNIIKWKSSLLNPGSMGFYNYLSFMECYSQVCVLNGDIIGNLQVNGELVDFTGGKVYIEKNWGKSFPKSWVWIQSNNFRNPTVSVTCSLATIPFPIRNFRGFLIGVTIGKEFYRFTTINNSKLTLKNIGQDIELTATNKNLKLTLNTYTNRDDFVLCMGPKNGNMIPLVKETLSAKVYMTLEDTSDGRLIYKGVGHSCGVEYGGKLINILDK